MFHEKARVESYYFFIKQLTKIETSSIFLNSHQKILENSYFKFSLRKFQNLNFHFMKLYSPNSTIIITTYPYIYLYIQQKLGTVCRPQVGIQAGQSAVAEEERKPNGMKQGTLPMTTNEGPRQTATYDNEKITFITKEQGFVVGRLLNMAINC